MIDSIKHADLWLFLIYLGSITCITCSCKFGQSATTDQKQITKLGWGDRCPLKHLTWSAGTSSAISSTVLLYVVLLLFMIGSRHMRNRAYINIRPNTTITNIITTWKNIKRRKLSWINYELPMSGSGIALICVHVQRFVEIAYMPYSILPHKSWNRQHMNLYNNKSPASTRILVQIIYSVWAYCAQTPILSSEWPINLSPLIVVAMTERNQILNQRTYIWTIADADYHSEWKRTQNLIWL